MLLTMASPVAKLRDSGLLHGLLELATLNDLLGHPVCGLSYEGHCIENLIRDGHRDQTLHGAQPGKGLRHCLRRLADSVALRGVPRARARPPAPWGAGDWLAGTGGVVGAGLVPNKAANPCAAYCRSFNLAYRGRGPIVQTLSGRLAYQRSTYGGQ
jgi:hypothetical protein